MVHAGVDQNQKLVLNVTFLRRYSAAPVWDELGARATFLEATA